MFVVGKAKGAQHGLKRQCVLVVYMCICVELAMMSEMITDKSAFHKQQIRPILVDKALNKLKDINPLYKNVLTEKRWANVSEQTEPKLWNLLTKVIMK